MLRKAGRLADAQAVLEAGLKSEPDSPRLNQWMSMVLADEGRPRASVQYDLKARRLGGESPREIAALQQAFASGGEPAYRRAYLRLLIEQQGRAEALPFGYATELATVYAELQDRPDTMKWLLTAAQEHEDAPLELKSPAYAFLAGDPQFQALLKRVGL